MTVSQYNIQATTNVYMRKKWSNLFYIISDWYYLNQAQTAKLPLLAGPGSGPDLSSSMGTGGSFPGGKVVAA